MISHDIIVAMKTIKQQYIMTKPIKFTILLLLLPLLACAMPALGPEPTPTPTKTSTPFAGVLEPTPTSTPVAIILPTNTPIPTDTPTLVPPTNTPIPPTDTPTPEPEPIEDSGANGQNQETQPVAPPPTNTPVPPPPPTFTPAPPPPPTNTPAPPPPPANAGPQVIIEMPKGDTYDVGDEVTVIITVRDGDGVSAFSWGIFTENNTGLVGGDESCHGQQECRIEKSLDIPLPGQFFVGVEAKDGLDNGTIEKKQLYVG